HSDYINKFEETFAGYIGVKYAMATASCTGALHLALLSMGVGAGDEVIVPETTWIATVSAVKYVGAVPVFADIEPDTWVMDPRSVARLITPKTKCIIPVHLYGHPVDMDPISEMASKYGINILEDAAPSVGAEYKGKKTGSLGRASAFSFQGAKALVTGEGGMFLTNDRELMERARFLGDHGRDPHRALCNIEIGYKYKMSNIQAALGLAQIERVEEIVAKKRQIFKWYQERLSDIEGIQLNVERPWARNIFWMSSLILGDKIDITRDEFMKRLKERNIDTRPFFYPISSFPMFKGVKVNNPVAYKTPLRGINLPSGHDRTEEEVDYICAHIKEALGYKLHKVSSIQPHGWLAYRDKINKIIKEYKNAPEDIISAYCLPVKAHGENTGRLRPLTISSLEKKSEIELLSDWRRSAQEWFPVQFKVTFEGTRNWLSKQVLQLEDRILFMVETAGGISLGHAGLFRFNFKKRSCEIDNIVRGRKEILPGAMTHACNTLLNWAFETLDIETAYLRVVSNNERAVKLYNRLGFKEIQRVPLMKVDEGEITRWIEVISQPYNEIERYFITMRLPRSEWMRK
ncbi:MAG: GNAT family N-acetyltransferase, partial [Nitrospirae bacterium]|nr:GNAT family N-acetyltransferase [Nitrospirota bacterium]